eukprot:ctg_5080.g604
MDAVTVVPKVSEADAVTEQTPPPPSPMMMRRKRWQRHGRRQWSAGTDSEVLAPEGTVTEGNATESSSPSP